MRKAFLFTALALVSLTSLAVKPVQANGLQALKFDVAQGFNFNPASHASVGYLVTFCGLPGDLTVKTPDGTTKKVYAVLEGINWNQTYMGMAGRISAAHQSPLKRNATSPGANTLFSGQIECWAYDSFAKRYYKSLWLPQVSGDNPKRNRSDHRNAVWITVGTTPSHEVSNPVNYSLSFSMNNKHEGFRMEYASSASHKEILTWGHH